jgi:hypothetical protein
MAAAPPWRPLQRPRGSPGCPPPRCGRRLRVVWRDPGARDGVVAVAHAARPGSGFLASAAPYRASALGVRMISGAHGCPLGGICGSHARQSQPPERDVRHRKTVRQQQARGSTNPSGGGPAASRRRFVRSVRAWSIGVRSFRGSSGLDRGWRQEGRARRRPATRALCSPYAGQSLAPSHRRRFRIRRRWQAPAAGRMDWGLCPSARRSSASSGRFQRCEQCECVGRGRFFFRVHFSTYPAQCYNRRSSSYEGYDG